MNLILQLSKLGLKVMSLLDSLIQTAIYFSITEKYICM